MDPGLPTEQPPSVGVARVYITVGVSLVTGPGHPSDTVRTLTVVVVVGAFGLLGRKLPFAFQYEDRFVNFGIPIWL